MIVYVATFFINKGYGLRGPVNKWEQVKVEVYQGKEFAKRKAETWKSQQRHTSKVTLLKREVIFPSL